MNEQSMARSEELTNHASEFLKYKSSFLEKKNDQEIIKKNKQKIMEFFSANDEDWNDWQWQISNSISSIAQLKSLFDISDSDCEDIKRVSKIYRWRITPYYLSQMRSATGADPFFLQSVPSVFELDTFGEKDPMREEFTNPAGIITRRYPDRLTMNVTNCCAMFCRHCQRRRNIGSSDLSSAEDMVNESIDYIKNHPEIRDVLITGGDPLTLSDEQIESIIQKIRLIPSVEIIRIGSRVLATLPQRITVEFANMLKKYAPIYMNTQFNHPLELTREAQDACRLLADNGIVLGNQMVFLKGVNNDPFAVRVLNQMLLQNRVRPYYIFHPKDIIGTRHFSISIEEGVNIVHGLRGNTSGLSIPTYIINASGGLGKIALSDYSLMKQDDEFIYLTTWEGVEVKVDKHQK